MKSIALICVFVVLSLLLTTCASKPSLNFSSPENVAKGLWEALQRKDVDTALKYYLSLEEARSLASDVAGYVETLNRETRQLQREHFKHVEGGLWHSFEVEEEDYHAGHKVIEASIHFKKEGQARILGLALVNVKEGLWKLTDVDYLYR